MTLKKPWPLIRDFRRSVVEDQRSDLRQTAALPRRQLTVHPVDRSFGKQAVREPIQSRPRCSATGQSARRAAGTRSGFNSSLIFLSDLLCKGQKRSPARQLRMISSLPVSSGLRSCRGSQDARAWFPLIRRKRIRHCKSAISISPGTETLYEKGWTLLLLCSIRRRRLPLSAEARRPSGSEMVLRSPDCANASTCSTC